MQLDPKAVAVAQVPRKFSAISRSKLKQELDRMEEEQVIVKVDEPTDWVYNLVIYEKPDRKLRVCLHPKELNKYLKRAISVTDVGRDCKLNAWCQIL